MVVHERASATSPSPLSGDIVRGADTVSADRSAVTCAPCIKAAYLTYEALFARVRSHAIRSIAMAPKSSRGMWERFVTLLDVYGELGPWPDPPQLPDANEVRNIDELEAAMADNRRDRVIFNAYMDRVEARERGVRA